MRLNLCCEFAKSEFLYKEKADAAYAETRVESIQRNNAKLSGVTSGCAQRAARYESGGTRLIPLYSRRVESVTRLASVAMGISKKDYSPARIDQQARLLEKAKQFEDDHDNDNYPDYVEDASVHGGD